MANTDKTLNLFDKQSRKIIVIWLVIALVTQVGATIYLEASFQLFIFLWLVVGLIAVARGTEPKKFGLGQADRHQLAWASLANLGIILLFYLLLEPISHAYELLLEEVLADPPYDTTFGWLAVMDKPWGYLAVVLFTAVVSIFGEELVFRGLLLQYLKERMRPMLANITQAVLFTLPQSIVVLIMPLGPALVYIVFYSFVMIGCINGYFALRTGTIWPNLFTAVVANGVLTVILV